MSLRARLLRAYWRHVRRHDGEICHCCGGPVRVWWRIDDELWDQVMHGRQDLLCIPCFTRMASPKAVVWTGAVNEKAPLYYNSNRWGG